MLISAANKNNHSKKGMDAQSSPAKITRPRPGDVVPRHRLFRILDRAKAKPFLWIMGPPGAGKTALVADYLARLRVTALWYQIDPGDIDPATFFHYLTLAAKKAAPRHRRPLPRFAPGENDKLERYTRDYFLDLGTRLQSPFYLVFDNYHELPPDSALHDILRIAGDCLPAHTQIIVLSRLEPPPPLARARLHGDLLLLEGSQLALTLPEARVVSQKLRPSGRAQKIDVEALHKQTQGWTAGFVLLLKQTGRPGAETAPPSRSPGVLFEYFASEVFAKADAATQRVLLAASFLPSMMVRNVAALSGERRAGRILAQLHRNHSFTDRYDLAEPEYRFHPLFREFLRSRAQRLLPAEEFAALRRSAACLLEESDLYREEALSLYQEARDWPGWVRTFLRLAPRLVEEGRHRALGHWMRQVSPEIFGDDPWMHYWHGLANLSENPVIARRHLEAAMQLFADRNDFAGARRAWHHLLRALLAVRADRALLEECLARRDSLPATDTDEDADLALVLLRVLMRTGPSSRDASPWVHRAQTLLQAKADPARRLEAGAVLLRQHAQAGEPTQAAAVARHLESTFQRTGDATESQVEALAALTLNQWLAAETDAARRTIERAIALAEQGGHCRALPGLYAEATATALSINDLAAAEDWLDRQARVLSEKRTDEIVSHHLLANWLALLRGDLPDANEHLAIVRRLRPETLSWFVEAWFYQAQAQTQLQSGNPEKSAAPLADLLRLAKLHSNPRLLCVAGLLTAQLALEEGRVDDARVALAEALQTGRRQGIVNFHSWLPRPMTRLCALALEHNIEAEYVRELIRLRNLPAIDDARDLDAWPWPVKIFSFGRLSILREEQTVSFSRRAQSRPLEMLTALLANGGRGVSEETLSAILWPDADGDAAHQAFDTNLFRLRRLLGHERALILSDAKLSLNPAVCWVDAWACERLFGRLDTLLRTSTGSEHASDIARLGTRLLALYRGAFLGRDHSAPWAVTARERLHGRFLRHLNVLIRYWEDNGQWEHAAAACERLIDIQPEVEEHYQRLMIAYREINRLADAAAVYQRCHDTLSAGLGRPPSPATTLIFQDLGTFSDL